MERHHHTCQHRPQLTYKVVVHGLDLHGCLVALVHLLLDVDLLTRGLERKQVVHPLQPQQQQHTDRRKPTRSTRNTPRLQVQRQRSCGTA